LLTGSILNVRHAYNQSSDLDSSSRIQLGRQLAQGGFACVYVGRVLQLGDNPAATAEVAAAAHPDVVVMVYVASVPGCCVVQLQGYASNEHTALAMLQREEAVVRLLATAVLHPADAAGCNSDTQRSQHGFQGSGSSSRGSKGSNSQGGYLQTCLVLEYLPRGPVSNVQGKCPEIVAKTVLRPVLCLLELMHSGELGCRIVHRDIKPDNLLQRIPKSGRGVELVLSDFGCCFIELKPRANHPFVAGMHTCIGTSFFKAPEVASMVGRAAGAGGMGASIDCYAFGVTVTQVLGCLEVQEGMTVEDFQQQLADFVDAPGDHTASAAAREFVGCCCGVGRMRTVAAAYGESARMTPAQLLETAWMRSGS
jgi:serine/threonine protein kinase